MTPPPNTSAFSRLQRLGSDAQASDMRHGCSMTKPRAHRHFSVHQAAHPEQWIALFFSSSRDILRTDVYSQSPRAKLYWTDPALQGSNQA